MIAADKITRRQMVAVTAGSVVAAGAVSLTAQQPAAGPELQKAELEKARASHRENTATLSKFDIPQSTEPAFLFRP